MMDLEVEVVTAY